MEKLTKSQEKIYNVIKKYIKEHHYAPSYQDIADLSGLTSKGTIYKHIRILEKKGYIIFGGKPRTIALKKEDYDK